MVAVYPPGSRARSVQGTDTRSTGWATDAASRTWDPQLPNVDSV